MIHRIFSSTLPSFKELKFDSGLNVLVAEKSKDATSRQTRNAAGKSSMVEIIHFLLGGDCKKDSIFRCDDLVGHKFGLEFDLNQKKVEVERIGEKPSRIIINKADRSKWPQKGSTDDETGELFITNAKWKEVLGELVFNIPPDLPKLSPTFRSLFSYFARRVNDGAFSEPTQHFKRQFDWDWQVAISYLLGLDWKVPQEIEKVRVKEKSLKTLKRELKTGVIGSVIGSAASLKTKVTVAERKFKRLQEELSSFQVLPEYRELEKEASTLTIKIAKMSNENMIDEEIISEIEETIKSESPPALKDVKKVYQEAGIVLPGIALKRLEDVENFHNAIISNRRSHLQGELDSARNHINKRLAEMQQIDHRRREIMEILNSHGALDQYNKLQKELNRLQADVEELSKRHKMAVTIETTGTDLSIERKQLHRRLMNDHKEQSEIIEEAIIIFEEFSSELSEREGSLTIGATEKGPIFDIRVEASRSIGISSMQIFCFDLMLIVLCQKNGMGPGFLVHDSHLFDGMDSRQIAKAFEIGSRVADEYGFQYIVTINSDMIPYLEFSKDFKFEDHTLPVFLTDDKEDGGLFGFRFE